MNVAVAVKALIVAVPACSVIGEWRIGFSGRTQTRQAGGRAAVLSRRAVEVIAPIIRAADAMIARHAFASS